MLSKPPEGAGYKQTELWRSMLPLTSKILHEYYAKASPDSPKPDYEDSEFADWSERNNQCIGTRVKDSMTNGRWAKTGIVRRVFKNGQINEGMFRDNLHHGLARVIDEHTITFFFYKDGFLVDTLIWDANLEMVEHKGSEMY